jgi:alkanesulfonate monooxygenase SsuD/methylene tetrahydromethanopterin reductase-like flavin-dependent oxidoreductase (luciferase family)
MSMKIDLFVESKTGPEELRELGLLAEQYGFHTLWVQNYARAPDAFMNAVPLAMAAKKIRVGVAAVSAYEMHPLRIANAVLTLNEMCAGGACVLVGAGGEWPGVMQVPLGKRITGAREAIQIIRKACGGETVNFDGEIYKSKYFTTSWAAHKQDRPPLIYAGASGPKMIKMATEVADGLLMSDVVPEMFDWPVPNLQAALAARDSGAPPFRVNNFIAWHVKEDAEVSYAEARREMMIRGWLEDQWIEPLLTPAEAEEVRSNKWPFLQAFRDRHGDIEGVDPATVQKLVDGLTLSGGLDSVDRHIEHLQQYQAAGFNELSFGLQDDPADAIRLLGEKVLPALQ